VKSTDAVHKYLTEKGWEQHIPKSFRPANDAVKRPRQYPIPVDTSFVTKRDQHKQQLDTIHEGISRRISQRIKQKQAIATAASLNVIMTDTPNARQHSVDNYMFNINTDIVEAFYIHSDEMITCDVHETFPSSQLQFGHGPLQRFLLR
jgi:hypothetical protein